MLEFALDIFVKFPVNIVASAAGGILGFAMFLGPLYISVCTYQFCLGFLFEHTGFHHWILKPICVTLAIIMFLYTGTIAGYASRQVAFYLLHTFDWANIP